MNDRILWSHVRSHVNVCFEYTNNPDIPKANVPEKAVFHGTLVMIITAVVRDLIIVETSIKIAFSLFATKPQHAAVYQSMYGTKCTTRMILAMNYFYYFSCSYFSFNFSHRYFSTCQQYNERMWCKNEFNIGEFCNTLVCVGNIISLLRYPTFHFFFIRNYTRDSSYAFFQVTLSFVLLISIEETSIAVSGENIIVHCFQGIE